MIGLPPSSGAVKLIRAIRSPTVADKFVGARGTVMGIASTSGYEDTPAPTAFTACSTIEYVKPLVKPVIVIGLVICPADVKLVPPSIE